jgi:hypothetical protein
MCRHFKNPAAFVFCFFLAVQAMGQSRVAGRIGDKAGNPLPGATIKVMNPDSSFVTGVISDSLGRFMAVLPKGNKYILKITLISFKDLFVNVETTEDFTRVGRLQMKEDSKTLAEVDVKGVQSRGEQKGDTTAFKADAFKTNPDATAEDLVKKMPGVTSDNNGVKVNGETVQKVLLDGKPFLGDDPNAAIKNIPAEIIDRVEIFDKMSDQSQFTGFNDGNQQKTINLVTKKGKNIGQFGKIYAGGGVDEIGNARYNGGATINSFNAKRRVSLLLLSNNINQQNFSISDVTGAMGSSGGGGRGGMGGASSLLTAPQNGITATQSAGLNYSDEWGKKIKVSGSYFFNYTDNVNHTDLVRHYFTRNSLVYSQTNDDRTTNMNHRGNFRFEYNIDSVNKLTITPSISVQNNLLKSSLFGSNTALDNILLSNTQTNSKANNTGYDFSNGILYQHKFRKEGRSISLMLNTQLTEKNNNGSYHSLNNYFSDTSVTGLDQLYTTYSDSRKASASLSWTEPLSKTSQLQFNYSPSYTDGLSNKSTNDYDTIVKDYVDFNTALSNKYNNVYQTQRGGISYKYNKNKMNLTIGSDVQQATLTGDQTFPVAFKINQSFQNILPNAQLNYRFNKSKNLRVWYRSTTNIPSIQQLQNVIDISNPLQVKTGNVGLKQTFENNLNIRFGGFNPQSSRNAMVFMNLGYINNYITNATYILRRDSVIQGYTLKSGSQLSLPVNLNNYYNGRAFFVYGFPFKAIKSNLNFNGGINYSHTPSLNNYILNYADNYASSAGLFVGSNISTKLDFSLGYNANYTIVKNSVQKQSNNNFFSGSATAKLSWNVYKGLVINTDLTQTMYQGLSQNFNQQYILWNAYVGYKFLKNKSLEAKIYVFDLLNQNKSISRTVNANYTEDNNTVVLRRYYMFTLTYTLRHFKGGTAPEENKQQDNSRPPWPMRPGGGHGGW